MIVVADTSPLNYLIQVECEALLPKLYGRILIPPGVVEELDRAGAPAAVRAWLAALPEWVETSPLRLPPSPSLAFLDLGEREAIQLAEEQNAGLLLIDERKGRLEAKRRGLDTTGTLGVLLDAGDQGLIDPEPAYRRLLRKTTFRSSPALEASS